MRVGDKSINRDGVVNSISVPPRTIFLNKESNDYGWGECIDCHNTVGFALNTKLPIFSVCPACGAWFMGEGKMNKNGSNMEPNE